MSESQEVKALRAELARIVQEIKRIVQENKRMDQEIKQRKQQLKDALRPRLGIIEKPRPSISTSPVFKIPVEYDEFSATVDLVATFIPNERLRAIRKWQPDSHEVDKLADFLRAEYHFALSLVHIAGGSKASPVDPNLRRVVKKARKLFDAHHRDRVAVRKKPQVNRYMAEAVQGERSLFDTRTDIVLIGCCAKGLDACHRECITQLLTLCGNGAMEMRRHGVALEECVTLGIAFTDTGIQFCAVYLMDGSFPMFLNLTTVLHPLHHAADIAAWLLRFVYGASLSSDALDNTAREPVQNLQLRLNTASLFLKPVREGYKGATVSHEPCQHRSILPSRLDHIFRIYDRLHDHYARLSPRPTDWSISFPVGCITVPSQESAFRADLIAAIRQQPLFNSLNLVLRPCLLFQRVQMAKTPSESLTVWRDFKPPANLVEPYLASFRRAVSFLNEAGIVHFDLRPCNVLWRSPRAGCVEVMLIDFDDALFGNQRIPRVFANAMRDDPRFPLYHMDKVRHPDACADHNTFYVTQQERWLTRVGAVTFDEFMFYHMESGNKKRKADEDEDADEATSTGHRRQKRGDARFITQT